MTEEMIWRGAIPYVPYSAHERLMIDKDQQITTLRAEVEKQVQWVKDLADNLIAEEAKTATLRAEIERLQRMLWEVNEQCPEHVPIYLLKQICAALAEEKPDDC
jgi:hypothetical protein